MTQNSKVILVGSGKNSQEHLLRSLAQFGIDVTETLYQHLSSTIRSSTPSDILLFNMEDITDELAFDECNKIANFIKSNHATRDIKILGIGISHDLCLKAIDHSFDDLIFGTIRIASVKSRIKSFTRLRTMQTELNRRVEINESFGLPINHNHTHPVSLDNANLLVFGQPNGFARIEEALSPLVNLVGALSKQAAKDYLERQKFDLMIINGGRNPIRYLEFVEYIRQNSELHSLPILLVAHASKLSSSHIAYEAGITDIVDAPANQNELVLRVKSLIKEHRFRAMMSTPYLEARHIPTNDALTGLYTYSYYRDHLERLVSDYKKSSRIFSLVTLSIENIKDINEQFGFMAGDKVLRQISDILMTINRGEDLISRISGRTFVLTLPNTTQQQAINVVHRIENILQQTEFICEVDCSPMTVKLMAKITEPDDLSSSDSLFKEQVDFMQSPLKVHAG